MATLFEKITTKLSPNPVLFIMAVSSMAFVLSFQYLKTHMVQYSDLPKSITLLTTEKSIASKSNGNKWYQFNLRVTNIRPIDSANIAGKPANFKITTDIMCHQNTAFMKWVLLISIMFAFAAGTFVFFCYTVLITKKLFQFNKFLIFGGIIASIGLVTILFFRNNQVMGFYYLPQLIDDFNILLTDGSVLMYIELTMVLLACPGLIAIFLNALAASKLLLTDFSVKAELKDAIAKHNYLREKTLYIVQALSVLVVFSVITSESLGNAIKSIIQIDGFDVYPKEMSLVYGAIFSAFLCIIYIPIYFYLKNIKTNLAEKIMNLSQLSPEEKNQILLENFTKADAGLYGSLKMVLTVATPLLSGILTNVVDIF